MSTVQCPNCLHEFEHGGEAEFADPLAEFDEQAAAERESFTESLRKRGGESGMKWFAANGGMVPRRVF